MRRPNADALRPRRERPHDDGARLADPDEWRKLIEESGFEIEAHYGWFDRRPYGGGEDSVWLARRPTE